MSDPIEKFRFDLQRFAVFKGGKVEGEEGITLSSLFNSVGRVWQTSDIESLGARTYFWENEDAKVSLATATDNAPGNAADGITLVKGVYDDPTKLDNGNWAYAIQSVEAVDASGIANSLVFANLEGVNKIVNPNGTVDISGDNLGAIKFNGGGTKTQDSDLDWEVGTFINLDGAGNIVDAEATSGEQITTADGTGATFSSGGTATFTRDSFDTIESFAQNGSAQLTVTDEMSVGGERAIVLNIDNVSTTAQNGAAAVTVDMDGQAVAAINFNATKAEVTLGGTEFIGTDVVIAGATVNVDNISSDSEVQYLYGATGGDILNLTAATADGIVSVSKTGNASFVVADDLNSDGTDVNIGDEAFEFTDAGSNGGVFVVENGTVVGFVFRDVGDALTIQQGKAQLGLYESSADNNSLGDVQEISAGFGVTSTEEDSTVTKTQDGYSVGIGSGAAITTAGGAIIEIVLPKNRGDTASVVFDDSGQIQSITRNV